ncbi:hypothetical protein [Paractinoplanes maris]|uniref:hypothetical protein n=1 Tax=Paractinoplanes maris TaxID=1734446 RepID=UPI00201FCA47|nr:hypothetical protein [Actinoplanes maris]
MTVRWWSQPFAPEGSAAAEGIVKQLGRPALDPLAVLVREAAQNSWDARLPGAVVDFEIDVRILGTQTESWRHLLLPGPAVASNVELEGAFRPGAIALVISDRDTVGLGGPLRAGIKAQGDEKADFVQFLRNVGEPSDHEFGGGTYGFGKGIFYRISRVGAILVDTNTEGESRRRLMGAALGHSWYSGDRRFTGRHWWGEVGPDDVPDPIVDDEAAAFSRALNLPGFADGRTGTDIVVLAADLGLTGHDQEARERSPHEAATYLTSAILWNLWPKMVPDESGTHMRFFVGVDGSRVRVPSPETLEDFAPFVEALQEIRAGSGSQFARTVPPKDAGALALSLAAAGGASARHIVTAARPFDGPSNHVARMRVAELVVDYLPGPPHPDSRLCYGGVFRASEDADELFASSEPPTHDDWVSKGLSGAARGVVQGARTFILKQIDERFGMGTQAGGSGGQGLGQFAARLASVVPARLTDTPPAGGRPGTNGGGGNGGGGVGGGRPARGGAVRLSGPPSLRFHDGRPFLVATVHAPASSVRRVVTAEVEVVVEGGGREGEPPAGALVPQILQWQSVSDAAVVQGAAIMLSPGQASDWYVLATYVPDAVVRFKVGQEVTDAG